MAPSFLVLVGALAALGVVAGDVHRSWAANNGNGLFSLRGGRRLQGDYCNTIGCPAGYTPIVDAQFVECDGTCEESQCCEAFCSYHACPNNYIPIEDAATTSCDASGCTDALCCESGMSTSAASGGSSTSFVDDDATTAEITTGDSAGVYCNSIGCPDGYTPIDDAQSTVCDGDTCEESQCCEAFCSYHACPDGYVPTSEADTTLCADSGCTDDLCCESWTEAMTTSNANDDDFSYTFSIDDTSASGSSDDATYSYSFN